MLTEDYGPSCALALWHLPHSAVRPGYSLREFRERLSAAREVQVLREVKFGMFIDQRPRYSISDPNPIRQPRTAAMAQPQTIPIERSLKNISLFADLSSEALERVERLVQWSHYKSGTSIVVYGDETSAVFFVIKGEARVTIHSYDGKHVSFRDLGAGDIFGEYAAIDRTPRSASVDAQTDCYIASMPATAFREQLETEPKVAKALLAHLVRELRELTTRVYEFSMLCVNNRIQAELLRMARHVSPEGNVADINPAPTHAIRPR